MTKKLIVAAKPIVIMLKLQKAKTDKQKIKIIKDAWQSDNDEFFVGLDLMLNPLYPFNLKSVAAIEDEDDGEPGSLTFAEFFELATNLAKGQVPSQNIKNMVDDAALRSNISEWNLWYRRILLKSLPDFFGADILKTALTELTAGGKAVK